MKLADILRAGKARIERGPWGQGNGAIPPHGACCVLTAIAGPQCQYNDGAINLFERANDISPNDGAHGWNDAPGRTKEEVLAAFDKAIALAEQQEAS